MLCINFQQWQAKWWLEMLKGNVKCFGSSWIKFQQKHRLCCFFDVTFPAVCRIYYMRTSYSISQLWLLGEMSMLKQALLLFCTSLMILSSSSSAAKVPMAKPGCQETCGNVTIPYPFGIGGPNCYLNPWFEITCNHSLHSRPFLRRLNLEVLYSPIMMPPYTMLVNHPIYSTCRDGNSWNSTDLKDSPFIFSGTNTFTIVGGENILMTMRDRSNELLAAGCTSTSKTCTGMIGINCCEISIPNDLDFYSLTTTVINTSACTYAFLATDSPTNFWSDAFGPVWLTWGVNSSDLPAGIHYHDEFSYDYRCESLYNKGNTSLFNCKCSDYYEGNPYIENGCRVVPACTKCKGSCEGHGRGKYRCRPTNTTTEIIIAKVPMAKPGCQETCGNVIIPYPFGIGDPNCYLNSWYEITCNHSLHSRPFLRRLNLEVLDLGFDSDAVMMMLPYTMVVNQPFYSTCRDGNSWNSTDLKGSPFIFSGTNTFMTTGCATILMRNRTKQVVDVCTSTCRAESPSSYGVCYGIECFNFPYGLDFYSITSTDNKSACTNAFVANDNWYQSLLESNPLVCMTQDHLPVSLTWGVNSNDLPWVKNNQNVSAYSCDTGHTSSLSTCWCNHDYEGNPYILNGCLAIPATQTQPYHPPSVIAKILSARNLGVGAAIVILVIFCFGMFKIVKRRMELKLKKKFFKRNGGLLLQQQLSSNEDSFDTTKIFTVEELEKATDSFNINRVLGRGGQGTVYKGMLTDGMIVAVKKSTLVHEAQVDQFINEVAILSQINHRNIVKLLGCCLETEVPLLVYEYIPNGTLSQLIRSQDDEFPLSWKMRLEIASEISGALAYLHSTSSVPIYHRDIKSSNILLDGKYRAKVADFGTSRSVAIDQTHLTTIVQGTFGYLDPEFFRSSQFTDKSDVYSFGVVLAELLTGERPIMSRVGIEEKSLAVFFISALEEDFLFDIIDERVAREGKKDEVIGLANLARRCLNLNGKQRPTMREVMFEIERIRMSRMPSRIPNEFHHVSFTSERNQKVEDHFNSVPFPDYTGSPSSEFNVAR